MLKKIILVILPILAILSCWLDKERPIHIFLEVYATNPALLEMTEFVKLPPKDPKIIAWHRFPNRALHVNLAKYNTIEIGIPAREGYYQYSPQKIFIPQVMEALKKNPNAPIILYSNINQTRLYLIPLLQQIAPKRIKQIHIYEDGMCQIIGPTYETHKNAVYSFQIVRDLNDLIRKKRGTFKSEFMTSLHKLYPTTYHVCEADMILKDKALSFFVNWIGKKNIKNVDIKSIRNSLSKKQQNDFAQLIGLDLKKYEPLFKYKKTFIFTTGYLMEKADSAQVQINILRQIKNGIFKQINPDEYTFFFKPHPAFRSNNNSAEIQKEFPDIVLIPAKIPLESFLITGLIPTNVSGAGSSLLFSLPSKIIGLYIPHKAYTNALIRLKKITKEQFINPNDFLENVK